MSWYCPRFENFVVFITTEEAISCKSNYPYRMLYEYFACIYHVATYSCFTTRVCSDVHKLLCVTTASCLGGSMFEICHSGLILIGSSHRFPQSLKTKSKRCLKIRPQQVLSRPLFIFDILSSDDIASLNGCCMAYSDGQFLV